MRRIRDKNAEIEAQARLEVEHYSAQLELALREKWSMRTILDHKTWIARALLVLGKFDEARSMAQFEKGIVRVKDKPKLEKVLSEIDEMELAISEDDAAYCDCRHLVDLNPATTGQPQIRELSSYSPTGRKAKSIRHKTIVELYKCLHCGHVNALPEPPDAMLNTAKVLRSMSDKAKAEQPDYAQADHTHYAKA